MDRKCIKRIICEGQAPGLEADSPVTNYSSEYNDGTNFPSRRFPPFPPYDPGITPWASEACGSYECISYISQEDADDCAAALAVTCVLTPHPPTDPTPFCISNPTACLPYSPGVFVNDEQSATQTCADGTVFTWTINAGTIVSSSTSLANQIALQLAKDRVLKRTICLNDIDESACAGSSYSETITASGVDFYTLEIVDGAVPDGMTVTYGSESITISGTPTGPGVSFFTVRATGLIYDAVFEKTYVISVIEITTASPLPDAEIGTAYSTTISALGGSPPIEFTLANGTSLPTGLSLSTAGVISGTPTESGETFFDVAATDANGAVCVKTFGLTVSCLITTVALASGTDGVAYSQTLTANGGTAPFVWSVVSGALPSGLSLNSSTGEISGTPDTDETQVFTVQLLTSEGISCEKELSITIASSACADWSTLSWSFVPFVGFPTTTQSYSASGASFTGSFTAQETGPNPAQTQVQMIGSLVLNTTALCCGRLSLDVTRLRGGPSIEESMYAQIGYTYGGSEIWVLTGAQCVNGSQTHDFQLPNTGGVNVTIYFTVAIIARSSDFTKYGIDASGTLSAIPCP